MCISERLKLVLDAKNMTVTEFSNVTGISYRSAMNYLNEGREPSSDVLIKIHNGLDIDINWLLVGNGNMFCHREKEHNLSAQEKKLILNYRYMSDDLKLALSYLIKEIIKMK